MYHQLTQKTTEPCYPMEWLCLSLYPYIPLIDLRASTPSASSLSRVWLDGPSSSWQSNKANNVCVFVCVMMSSRGWFHTDHVFSVHRHKRLFSVSICENVRWCCVCCHISFQLDGFRIDFLWTHLFKQVKVHSIYTKHVIPKGACNQMDFIKYIGFGMSILWFRFEWMRILTMQKNKLMETMRSVCCWQCEFDMVFE